MNGKNCVLAKQIKEGNTLIATLRLQSKTNQETAVAVMAIYSGDNLVKLHAVPVSFEESSTELKIENIPSAESYMVECYLFDSFQNCNPLSKIWSLN